MPKSQDMPAKINDGYLVLPLQLPATQSLDAPATHYLYLRRHQPRIPTADDSRSLFAANLPVDATESQLRTLFSTLGGGRIESVLFDHSPATPPTPSNGNSNKRKRPAPSSATPTVAIQTWDRRLLATGSTAILTFIDAESSTLTLRAILRTAATAPTVWTTTTAAAATATATATAVTPAAAAALGAARYAAHHRLRFPSTAHLQLGVDAFMAAFAEAEEEAGAGGRRRRGRQVPDEDGFVVVTRGGRRKPGSREEAAAAVAAGSGGGGELKGFYRFQIREERKERQAEMLRRFEEDRRRVEERKKGRRFRPE